MKLSNDDQERLEFIIKKNEGEGGNFTDNEEAWEDLVDDCEWLVMKIQELTNESPS